MKSFVERLVLVALVAVAVLALATPASARIRETDPEYKDLDGVQQQFRVGPYASTRGGSGALSVQDVPDIFGPGAVLTVGNIFMKCTNYGLDGNPFSNLSTDPSGQWPGASSIEYLNYIGFAVGAVNPLATDPTALRRVSYITEWRPPTLDPVDRMYRSYDGIVNGQRYVNEDSDSDPITGEPRFDEDFPDGRDNDGDGKVDEDYGALGQQMYSCVMRDDTPQAINASAAERHVPLGVELRHTCWAYSIPGYTDFNVLQYDIYNRSGHTLDSVVIGFRTDMDCGPVTQASYWTDDYNLPQYPHGTFLIKVSRADLRRQDGRIHEDGSVNEDPHLPVGDVDFDSPLCPVDTVRIIAWSTIDDNGDDSKTPGIPTVQLIDHTIDPLGESGPARVGLTSFRSFSGGLPYASGGSPTIDQQRYEMMTSTDLGVTHIDKDNPGFVDPSYITGDQKGDYSEWASIGPWKNWPDGGHLSATLAFGVQPGTFALASGYSAAYEVAKEGNGYVNLSNPQAHPLGPALVSKYKSLENALAAQLAFRGADEFPPPAGWTYLGDFHGRETGLRAPRGQTIIVSNPNCPREADQRTVTEHERTWFDLDCNYCTGGYSAAHGGLFHRAWVAEAPPPSPNTNLSVGYNYTDNPQRTFIPTGDHQVTLAWNNLSETTVDPLSKEFDFRGYKVWKVSDWRRPVGAGGPFEDDWTLLADYRLFDAHDDNRVNTVGGQPVYPQVFVPTTGQTKTLELHRGDFWNAQTGEVLQPDDSVKCTGYPNCKSDEGYLLGHTADVKVNKIRYPIGRYHIVDRNVKNGFVYFYSVTAYDSTGRDATGSAISMLNSRRSAVEAEGVVPQIASTTGGGAGKGVWVVPNPYRGLRSISARPSSWDLTPNATDPTGTHVDFLGLPRGAWTIQVYTVSGDLVQTLKSTDPVNESIRVGVTDDQGTTRPGFNRQADSADDGEARWNLISRSGQDVVSGIYLFTVEVGGQVKHRGKFVIIR